MNGGTRPSLSLQRWDQGRSLFPPKITVRPTAVQTGPTESRGSGGFRCVQADPGRRDLGGLTAGTGAFQGAGEMTKGPHVDLFGRHATH